MLRKSTKEILETRLLYVYRQKMNERQLSHFHSHINMANYHHTPLSVLLDFQIYGRNQQGNRQYHYRQL